MTQTNFCPNAAVPFPQRLLEILGQLQARNNSTVSTSIYIYDLVEQRTLCASYPVAAMLGYTTDAIHAMGPIGLANLIHPNDLNRVLQHYQQFITLPYGEVISIEYRMRRADGAWSWLRSQETPLVEAIDGFPLQILGMLQNLMQEPTAISRRPVALASSLRRYRSARSRRTCSNRQKHRMVSVINRPKSAS